MKKTVLALAFAGSILATPAGAAIVNVDGSANASLNGTNAVVQNFAAGTYRYTFVSGLFDAFSRFSSNDSCNSSGAQCRQGFENSVRLVIGGETIPFGDGGAAGDYGPQATGGYYSTAAQSLAAASQFVGTFTLTTAADVSFFIFDDQLSDNRGGVSLSVAAVPEPATWGMMMLGFGAMGFAMRRRAKVRTAVAFG